MLGRPACIVLAMVAALYNGGIAPALKLDRAYRREGESRWGGLFTYALAVLVLVSWFEPLAAAAGGWTILAALDPAAAGAGARWRRPAVPGNRDKSLVGTLAGFLAAAALTAAVLWRFGVPVWPAVPAAAAAAVVEAGPWPDDNLPVALTGGLVLAFLLA